MRTYAEAMEVAGMTELASFAGGRSRYVTYESDKLCRWPDVSPSTLRQPDTSGACHASREPAARDAGPLRQGPCVHTGEHRPVAQWDAPLSDLFRRMA